MLDHYPITDQSVADAALNLEKGFFIEGSRRENIPSGESLSLRWATAERGSRLVLKVL
jgi:hypothetical protein